MIRTVAIVVLALLAAAAGSVGGASAALVKRGYPATTAEIRNPERGFWRFLAEDFAKVTTDEVADLTASGLTLGYGVVRLDAYRTGPLPASLLTALSAAFQKSRTGGIKIILRFAYNYPDSEFAYLNAKDAPLSVVLGHIAQLKPVLAANADVIAVLQAGFIGAWGEGHTSSNGLDSAANKIKIRDALLGALPAGRMLQWRYPPDLIAWAPTPPVAGSLVRLGLHNDCFMSSDTDVGTYDDNSALRVRQRTYAAAVSRASFFGGETCDVGSPEARMTCPAILAEGRRFHVTTLNRDYSAEFFAAWTAGGCLPIVSRSLGYRLVITEAGAPDTAKRGSTAIYGVRLRNEGWARVVNPRTFRLIATHRATGRAYAVASPGNIRMVEPEDRGPETFNFSWKVPADAPTGVYDLDVALPDAASKLAADPRYAIRFANGSGTGFGWNAATGRYRLGLTTQVTAN